MTDQQPNKCIEVDSFVTRHTFHLLLAVSGFSLAMLIWIASWRSSDVRRNRDVHEENRRGLLELHRTIKRLEKKIDGLEQKTTQIEKGK